MEEKKILLRMIQALVGDMQNIQQRGAGYYTSTPFVERYNQLLEKAKTIFSKESLLLDTFNPLEDTKSVDPADKMKVIQKVIIEAGQLIAYIKAALEK